LYYRFGSVRAIWASLKVVGEIASRPKDLPPQATNILVRHWQGIKKGDSMNQEVNQQRFL